jgi:Flp pilus assembly secretin CpaC
MVAENNANNNVLASNDSYGVGLAFGSFVDLSNTKISVRIQSAVSSSLPYSAYMFFTGIVSV